MLIKTKICYKCKKEYPASEFRQYKSGKNKGLYYSYCKSCAYLAQKSYNKKEDVRRRKNESKRQWLEYNSDVVKEYSKKYYKEHAEHEKTYNREYFSKNRDKINCSRRDYYYINKLKFKYYYHKRRDKMRDFDSNIISEVYERNIENFGEITCYLCLNLINVGKECLEHKIPLSRNGTNNLENLDLACQSCNSKKHDKTYEEYIGEAVL